MVDPTAVDFDSHADDAAGKESGSESARILACPACRGVLEHGSEAVNCKACNAVYPIENGYPILLVPGDKRFDDAADCCLNADEVRTNSFTTTNYMLPLLQKLFRKRMKGKRLLSAGCGVGADVDLYRNAGIDAYGIDCGSRSKAWPEREHKSAFHFGSVEHLPYPDSSFDAIVTGCLLPHIGVVGDTSKVGQDWKTQRQRVAAELMRVLRPGGFIIVGNPNRLCPLDLFHKGQMNGPNSLVRWHSPTEKFLLSFADHKKIFGKAARLKTLPVAGYWGFHSKRQKFLTSILALALRGYFVFLSVPQFSFLRRSPLNPWLMILITKERR